MKRVGQHDHEIMLLHNSPINVDTALDYHALDDRIRQGAYHRVDDQKMNEW